MKKFLPFLILVSALSVSGSAAFYSVFGLGKLFAGASVQVMIMAGSLEFSKLVMATALHRYWKIMNKWMRGYLTLAVCVLICITSAGIYGFLSSAYQITAAKDSITSKEINILELKKKRFTDQHAEYVAEKDQIISNITELRKSLSNPNQVQFVDRKTGQLVTTTSDGSRKSLETQLKDAVARRDLVSIKIEAASDSIATMDVMIVEAQASSDTANELGPLKYLSELTGKPMGVIVNWFLLLLIFVFDPLAVMLIILANFSFENVYGKHFMDVVAPKRASNKNDNEKISNHVPFTEYPRWMFFQPNQGNITGSDATHDANSDIRVAEDSPVVSRTIIDSTVDGGVSERMKNFLDSGSASQRNENALSDLQRRNMTHQEIEQWYRENSI